jgi:hypothetical protein
MGSDIMKEVDSCVYERQPHFKDRDWIIRGVLLEPVSCGKHDYCYENKRKLHNFSE